MLASHELMQQIDFLFDKNTSSPQILVFVDMFIHLLLQNYLWHQQIALYMLVLFAKKKEKENNVHKRCYETGTRSFELQFLRK